MINQFTKQALANDIKNEILMDLNRAQGRQLQEQDLVNSVKQEVLRELGQQDPNRAFAESIKNEVLATIHGGGWKSPSTFVNPNYQNRATIDSVKREVLAQIEAEQEGREETQEQGRMRTMRQPGGGFDPALVQAVKNSVMAEINAPYYR